MKLYIQKNAPHKALEKMKLEEAFIVKGPNVSNFKIFGNLVYYHNVLGDQQSKLD